MESKQLAPPDVREDLADRSQARLRGEDVPSHYEAPLLTRHGETRWLDVNAARVEMNGRSLNLVIGVDITERRHLQDQLLGYEGQHRPSQRAVGTPDGVGDLGENVFYGG